MPILVVVLTPNTMPTGNSTPKANIWRKIWIHNTASCVRYCQFTVLQSSAPDSTRRTIGSFDMVSPSSMWSVPCSWPSAMGKQAAAAMNNATLRKGVEAESNRAGDTEAPAGGSCSCIMACSHVELNPAAPVYRILVMLRSLVRWWRVVAGRFGFGANREVTNP